MKIPTNICILLLLYASTKTGYAQRSRSPSPSTDRRNNAQTNSCGLTHFRCHDGQCIPNFDLCDGRANCKDGSDETEQECRKPSIACSVYAFRCAYGACVDGDAPCNGVRDCVDNSDETLARCNNSSTNDGTTGASNNSPCRPGDQFRCRNNQCIDKTNLCDGRVHCSDGSDETITECGSISCPQTVFRCTYGACIDGDLKCDGVVHCADGSDEDPQLCGDSTSTTTTQRSTFTTPSTTTARPTPTPWRPRPARQPCELPSQPANGQWRLHKSQCQSNDHCSVQYGIRHLDPGTRLVYSCNSGYQVTGAIDVFCGPEGKWSNSSTCTEIRCKALSSASTDAFCTYNNEWISCESPVRPQTTAKLTCRNSYRQDTSLLRRQRDRVTCNERGQWEPEPIKCVPVCGVVSTASTPLIVNGTRPNITEFPWHVTLYRAETSKAPKEFICGATIIQDNLLITAAHCIYDEANRRIDEPRKFYVATGNYFLDYDSPLHDQRIVRKGRVKNIYITCNYLGIEGNYAWDIAVLELEQPFVFSSFLVPICLDPSTYGDQSVLEAGNYGKVAGFGRTATGASSAILQSITVPYIPLNQCRSTSSTSANEKFITLDKFCAGYTNGSSVCDGDSGGGLVFKTGGLWYLRGIVSVGIGATVAGGRRNCDSHSYSLYTRVSNHIGWIQDVILKLELYGSFPVCSAS